MQKNITEEARTLGALLRLPYEKLANWTYSELAGHGFEDIRPAHSAVFRHILPAGSRLTELAERAQMTKQSMAYLVESLRELGYLELSPDPTDGRAKLVCLTQRGRAFQQAAMDLSQQAEAQLAARLGEAELVQLRDMLERLIAEMEAVDFPGAPVAP